MRAIHVSVRVAPVRGALIHDGHSFIIIIYGLVTLLGTFINETLNWLTSLPILIFLVATMWLHISALSPSVPGFITTVAQVFKLI